METSSRVLGREHPDTLKSMGNLAATYRNQGRWDEAIQVMSEVVQHRRKKIGFDHPHTIQSIRTLHEWQVGKI